MRRRAISAPSGRFSGEISGSPPMQGPGILRFLQRIGEALDSEAEYFALAESGNCQAVLARNSARTRPRCRGFNAKGPAIWRGLP